MIEGPLRIGEVKNCLLESLWRVHVSNVRQLFSCVKYIIAQIGGESGLSTTLGKADGGIFGLRTSQNCGFGETERKAVPFTQLYGE